LDLLGAAAQAPSAMNLQPWAFAIFHGRQRLAKYSERAKAYLLEKIHPLTGLDPRVDRHSDPSVNIFHGADTVILICAKQGPFAPVEDCFLAAENLMLAAHGLGLGSCPVGFARPWFNDPEVKAQLGIPAHYTPVLPIVIGFAAEQPVRLPKNAPEILAWNWE